MNKLHNTKQSSHSMYKYSLYFLYLAVFAYVLVVFAACSLDVSKQDSNTNNTRSTTEGYVVLLNDEVNTSTLKNTLNATIVSTLEVNGNTYAHVVGKSLSLSSLKAHELISYAEPNRERHTLTSSNTTLNDTLYTSQYAPQLTDLESVWEAGWTGKGVIVAVIDTGVNTLHEDFDGAAAFVEGKAYSVSPGIAYKTTDHLDAYGHGTHVAGIIAARKNNNKGIVGVAPEASIMPIQVSTTGSFSSFAIAASLKAAADLGVDIVNMSYGGLYTTSVEYDAIQYALEKGLTLIAASGNNGAQVQIYPASYPGVISVGASNGSNKVALFSTWNPFLSIVAPGQEILSLKADTLGNASNSYIVLNGTSMATPFAAGVAALIKQKFKDANPAQIKSILETTALDLGDPGFDIKYGHGRIRPKEALETTTLPNTKLLQVKFSLKAFTNALSNYHITLLNADASQPLQTIITNASGITSAYLPPGVYQFTSAYMGVSHSGTFTLNNTDTEAQTLSKEFINSDFDGANFYRITVYSTDTYQAIASADIAQTSFTLYADYRTTENTSVEDNLVALKDVLSYDTKTTTHKSKVFKAIPSTKAQIKYAIKLTTTTTSTEGVEYRIVVEQGNPSANPSGTGTASTDETNASAEPAEDLALTVGSPRFGKLAKDDIDYFVFTAP